MELSKIVIIDIGNQALKFYSDMEKQETMESFDFPDKIDEIDGIENVLIDELLFYISYFS